MRLLVFLLFAALTAFGADVAGKWKGTVGGQDGPREVVFVFEVHDGKLSGTALGPHGDAPITEGKVDGDKINFTVATDNFKAVLTGTVAGDEMKLSATVGDRTFDFPVKRVKE
ncbi:MAG TPA: hypothetical protein VGL72_24245 [Bryobacteraceae bacterium]|jgi:hypothetical protein